MKYSLAYIRKAFRVNTLKISVPELIARLSPRWVLDPGRGAKMFFWIKYKGTDDTRFDVGNFVEHMLGYIYIQDPRSMIPAIVLMHKPQESSLTSIKQGSDDKLQGSVGMTDPLCSLTSSVLVCIFIGFPELHISENQNRMHKDYIFNCNYNP